MNDVVHAVRAWIPRPSPDGYTEPALTVIPAKAGIHF